MARDSRLSHWSRRLLTISAFVLLATLLVATAPAWLLVAASVDTLRRRRLAWTRGLTCVAAYIVSEALGVCAGGLLALAYGPWRGVSAARYEALNRRLQVLWVVTLLRTLVTVYGLRLVVQGRGMVDPEAWPLLLLFRHVSLADTLLPIYLLGAPHGLRLRHVLKRELLWNPAIDLVGNRLRTAFVKRVDAGPEEVAAVAALGVDLNAGEGVVLYPEGTRFSVSRRLQALARLEERGDHELLARAVRMTSVLPPRLGGTLALLESCPENTLVIFGAHVGFEGSRTFAAFMNGALIGQTIRILLWSVPKAKVPREPRARSLWLYDQWAKIDAFVRSPPDDLDDDPTIPD